MEREVDIWCQILPSRVAHFLLGVSQISHCSTITSSSTIGKWSTMIIRGNEQQLWKNRYKRHERHIPLDSCPPRVAVDLPSMLCRPLSVPHHSCSATLCPFIHALLPAVLVFQSPSSQRRETNKENKETKMKER